MILIKKHDLDLTKVGCSRSRWDLDAIGKWVKETEEPLTYHGGDKLGYAENKGYFQSSRQGQEFIINKDVTQEPELRKWLNTLLKYKVI